jgi:hypothetical protein
VKSAAKGLTLSKQRRAQREAKIEREVQRMIAELKVARGDWFRK